MNDALIAKLADVTASMGITITERTRLAFGANAAKVLANVEVGGKVWVWTQGASDEQYGTTERIGTETPELASYVASVDARDAEYAKVRPNVKSFLTSRKVKFGISTPMKGGDDGTENVGFVITRKA